MAKERETRDDRLSFRLTEGVKIRFDEIAAEIGISPSALGAFVIGDFVRKSDKMSDQIVSEVSKVIATVIENQLDDSEFKELLKKKGTPSPTN